VKGKCVNKIVALLLMVVLIVQVFICSTMVLDIRPAKADSSTIYIRADGSIEPTTPQISSSDNVTYALTGNLSSSIVVEKDNITIDGNAYALVGDQILNSRGIDLSGRTNVTVTNVGIMAFYCGIFLNSSLNDVVRGNYLINNGWYDHGFGISLISSSNNTISENEVKHDWVTGTAYGITLDHSPNNTLIGNTIVNSVFGILLSLSPSNILANNTMNCPILDADFAVVGSSLLEYENYVDSSNTVGGKPIYYWIDRQGLTVPSDAGCVVLVNCTGILVQNLNLTGNNPSICLAYTTNCTITRNEVSMATAGIMLYYSSDNVISKNKVSSHWGNSWIGGICLISSDSNVIFGNEIKETMNYSIWYSNGGMWLDSSSHNEIYENTITTYHRGIFLNSSVDNMVYHNNFINSTQQAYSLNSVNIWDDGYPSGGNYWTDYDGSDTYSGIYQNETGSDGIGDTPYVVNANNRDNYPLIIPLVAVGDSIPPVIANVRHEPLYPMEDEVIHFYADVTDNVAVASVQLNYTLDGGATWLLKNMSLFEGDTYSTSLGPYLQFQILGFYVIAYDTSGNWNWGSELVPLVPQQPKIAPIVVSDVPSNLLPNGIDVGYNVTDAGIEIIANVTELGIGGAGLIYFIWYSVDGGITWIEAEMTYIGDFVWTYVIPSLTNILFKVRASDGSFSRVYWIIVGPWTYPIYLYFADNEQYYPVKGLDFDYEYTRDYNIADNKKSYDTFLGINYRPEDLDHDGFPDVPAYAYMNPKMIDDGCLVVEYWIYYAFNNYLVVDNHEHDFESIYLWVDIGTGRIKEMALSQHTWTNNYVFDISKPQKRFNIAVETGGHGMQLLQDNDNDGYPDLTPSGYYALTKPDNDYVITPPFFMYWTINPSSFVAKLYPWVIYDVRQNQAKHHLFGDDSILTEGLDSFLIFPNLIRSPTGTVDETATRLIYSNLVDLIGSRTLLQTSIALKIPMLEDYPGLGLAWMVSAPWYRIQFREPAKQWNTASFEVWASKQAGKFIISQLLGFGLSNVIEGAVAKAVIPKMVGLLASNIIGAMVDPVGSAIIASSGRVLGLQNGLTVSQIPEGLPVTNRSLTNGLYDLYLLFTNHTNDYAYEVRGITESDNYNFTVFWTNIEGRQLNFDVKGVPTHAGEVHRYVINWTMLEDQQLGVDVYVDQNGDGNFEHEFSSGSNLTGDEFLLATTTPTIQSCSSTGILMDIFDQTQSVYVRGTGYLPSTTYEIYLVNATTWTDGMLIPLRIAGTATAITSDSSGNLSATLSWPTPLPGKYDIVVDVNGDGHYNATIDALDKSYILIASGFFVVPEYWLGTILWIAACITAFGVYRKRRQLRLEQ